MLYYCPLEPYKERYTMQWSAPITGWLERNWLAADIKYIRIEGKDEYRTDIKIGCVLDAVRRSNYCFSQISRLLSLAEQGVITNTDTIYFDDFWHLGITALPYTFHQLNIHPKMFAYCHAQSVDEFDFTHAMKNWMRPIETGIGTFLSGIFVGSTVLQDLLVFGGVAPRRKIHVVGHPFNSEEVRSRRPEVFPKERQHKVIFSSRWDPEKNPGFFLEVAENVIKQDDDVQFIVCTGAEKLHSRDPELLDLLDSYMARYPHNIFLKEGLTKEEYYYELMTAKVQMNTADQDFISITLLESSVFGAYPLYPYFRSFPETFENKPGFMYNRLNVSDAVHKLRGILRQTDLWTYEAIAKRTWLYKRFDTSWLRMLHRMGIDVGQSYDDQLTETPYGYIQ